MIGITFKKIRTSKNISQKEVYSGIISRSFFQKFEKGQHSISVEKFQLLLNRINITYEEFMYQHHNKLLTTDYYLLEIFEAYWKKDTTSLSDLYDTLRLSPNRTEVFLSRVSLLFKNILLRYSEDNDNFVFIFDYLDEISNWSFFETRLFNNIMTVVPFDKRNQYFKKAQSFFKQSKELATINSEYANWHSYIYINYVHLLLEKKEFSLAKKALSDMKIHNQTLYTNERNELAYVFLESIIGLYNLENRHESIKIQKKIIAWLQVINKTNRELYLTLTNIHQSKSESYLSARK